ncbi:Lacal_2735 family protein [Constantimarinum furrinae]|uniref:Lacal_2735 family protein n=1 Tax=Constantimarinum furrinae TaxID=2562285 RepID=A0A7G8PR23_9FLAO|nr:Lacal_2735 family protein [Constantimarinum furrinae]QNJ96789.1 hypothetical protein ALE3EI_0199 [Constantimarinum furrinae]
MYTWFKKQTQLEKLKKRYTALMRKSYNTALYNSEKSDRIHHEADEVYKKIQMLTLKSGDK